MAALLDLCRFAPTAGGTSDWTFSSAVVGYQSPTLAGVVNTRAYKYRAESADLSQWELGEGTYNTGTGVLTRTTVLYNSLGTGTGVGQSGAGNKINFSTTPQVAIVITKEDFLSVEEDNSFTATQRTQARKNISAPIKGAQFGCILSTAGASATFGITAGDWADSTGVDLLTLGSAFTKTTAAWAVGTGNGSFDGTGSGPSAAIAWYHVFLIKRPDTGVVDILTSQSATAPTLPTNYTLFRRIGSLKTNGSFQWIKFVQLNDEFMWDVPIVDASASALGATAQSFSLSVPTGIQVEAWFNFSGQLAGASPSFFVTPLDIADSAPSGFWTTFSGATSAWAVLMMYCRTNTSGQVRARASNAGTQIYFITHGWLDTRGRMSP